MGRFYQTADPEFVDDPMFKLPWELMGTVLEKKEKAVDDTITSATDYLAKLKANVLDADKPEYAKRKAGYEGNVDNIVQNIMADPSSYNKYQGQIREMGRGIANDWSPEGRVGSMEANRGSYLSQEKTINEMVEKGKITPEYGKALLAQDLQRYGGVKFNAPGDYNPYTASKTTMVPEFNAWADKALEGFKPEGQSLEKESASGMYFYKHKGEKKYVSPEMINNYLMDAFGADTDMQEGLKQRMGMNLPGFDNYQDEEGNFISPVSVQDGKYQYAPHGLGQAFSAAVNKHAFMDKATSDTMSVNTAATQARQRSWDLADKEAEKAEEIAMKAEPIYSNTVWNANNYKQSVTALGQKLTANKGKIEGLIKLAGLNPKTDAATIAAIRSGDEAALALVTADPATAKAIANEYKNNVISLNVLNGTRQGFQDYLAMKGDKKGAAKAASAGWTSDPKLMEEYNKYATKKGFKDAPFQISEAPMTWNGLNMNEATKKEIRGVVKQTGDKLGFSVLDKTNAQMKFQDVNGNDVIYINPGSAIKAGEAFQKKDASGKPMFHKNGKPHLVQYVKPKNGYVSIADLKQRQIANETRVQETDEDGNVSTVSKYEVNYGGKKQPISWDDKTFAPVHATDQYGNTNYGMKARIGNNDMTVYMNSDEISTPTTKKAFASAKEIWEEKAAVDRTNWKAFKAERNWGGNKNVYKDDAVYFNGHVVTDPEKINQFRSMVLHKQE